MVFVPLQLVAVVQCAVHDVLLLVEQMEQLELEFLLQSFVHEQFVVQEPKELGMAFVLLSAELVLQFFEQLVAEQLVVVLL